MLYEEYGQSVHQVLPQVLIVAACRLKVRSKKFVFHVLAEAAWDNLDSEVSLCESGNDMKGITYFSIYIIYKMYVCTEQAGTTSTSTERESRACG